MADFLPVTDCTPWSKNGRSWLKLILMSSLPILFSSSIPCVLLKMQQIDLEDLLCPAPTGLPSLKMMMEMVTQEEQTNDLKEVVNKLISDSIRKDVEKAWQSIYLLHDVFVRKVKILKKLKFEQGKLQSIMVKTIFGEATGDETGAKVEWANGYEPPRICLKFRKLMMINKRSYLWCLKNKEKN